MEIVLRNSYGEGMWNGKRFNVYFGVCNYNLKQLIDIPVGTRKLIAVFSTVEPECVDDTFTIRPVSESVEYEVAATTVRETQRQPVYSTMQVLARAYLKGYRFVHFEYEE